MKKVKINLNRENEFTDNDKAKVAKYVTDMMTNDSSCLYNQELDNGLVSLQRSYDHENDQYVFGVKKHDKKWDDIQ